MPVFSITKEIKPSKSFRTDKVINTFDLQMNNYTERFEGDIALEGEWNVGLIVGRSGTGKTTIARQLFGIYEEFTFTNKSIIDEMPKERSFEEVTHIFSLVGFSSPPSWLKPYGVLSEGEKMRVRLAYALLSETEIIVFDEFTSVVDRDVAKVISMVIRKAATKLKKKFIAIACHHDIIEWLAPDWIFNTDEMSYQQLKKKDQNLLSLFIKPAETYGAFSGSITI